MGEKESILIIDDDEGTRKSLSLILDRKGYDIGTAATGREALKKARERAYNVALLDIKLPDIDGTELLAPLRKIRPALGIDKALKEISQNRGSLYDPEVVDACLKLFAEKRFKFSKVTRVNFKQSVRVSPAIISSSLPGLGAATLI